MMNATIYQAILSSVFIIDKVRVKREINNFCEIFHGQQSVKITYFTKKIRSLKTALNSLKHDKKSITSWGRAVPSSRQTQLYNAMITQ